MTTAASSSESRAGGEGIVARLWRTPLRDLLRGRLSGRLNVRLQIASAALPSPVADLVLKVVKRTRLWRLEKAEVCEELIAHFADGLAAEALPEQLIESFGDARAAARLIRRAKKRQRPLPWHAARYAMRGIAAIILLYLLYGVYFWLGSPSPTTDYLAQLNAVAASVPDEDRAWPLYRAALLELDDLPTFEGYNRVPRPGEIGWAEAQTYLAGQQEALALARRAAQRPGLGFIVGHEVAPEDKELWPDLERAGDDTLISVYLPYLADLRRLGKVLALDARQAASAGDGETVVADLTALLGMAHHVREAPILICDLVSMSIVRQAIEVAEDVLIEQPEALTEAQLAALAHRLAACDACLKGRLDGERMTFYDIVQRVYTDDGEGDGRMTVEGLRLLTQLTSIWGMDEPPVQSEALAAALSPAVGFIMPSRRAIVEDYERLMAQFESEASRPLWERGISQGEQMIETRREGALSRIQHLLSTVLLPALGKVHITSEKAIMRRDALLAAIALELHHRRHGAWPATLDELVPELLPAVPPDRFDGQPLRYALIDGKPVLYCIGADRDDDGGRPPLTSLTHRPDYQAAQRWLPPSDRPGGREEETIPDGDWVLWPRPVEPIYRYEP